ncbi:hypothetical protein BGLA2_990087 [Burkholderia gladioli]|nr:hypothetical protein BGLA2_990087 [Burkholderia gladioli]
MATSDCSRLVKTRSLRASRATRCSGISLARVTGDWLLWAASAAAASAAASTALPPASSVGLYETGEVRPSASRSSSALPGPKAGSGCPDSSRAGPALTAADSTGISFAASVPRAFGIIQSANAVTTARPPTTLNRWWLTRVPRRSTSRSSCACRSLGRHDNQAFIQISHEHDSCGSLDSKREGRVAAESGHRSPGRGGDIGETVCVPFGGHGGLLQRPAGRLTRGGSHAKNQRREGAG